jgi:chorismate mutase
VSGLEPFRRRLDELDDQIARLLGERFEVCREIALFKREHEIPMMQPDRVAEVRARYLARGAEVDLPSDFTANLFELLIGATCRMEDELMASAVVAASFPMSVPSTSDVPSPATAPQSRVTEPDGRGA